MQTSTTPAPPSGVPGQEDSGAADDAGSLREPAPSSPVFVDGSGRRRKTWRRLTIGVVAALCGYACLLGIGFAGGPIPPAALLPIPGVPGNGPATTAPPAGNASDPSSPGAAGAHAATPKSAGHTTGVFGRTTPSHGDAAATDASTRPTTSQPGSTANPSGTAMPTAPSGTTVVTPSGTASSTTHGPQATPPSHSHSKTP